MDASLLSKSEIRKAALERRDALDAAVRVEASLKLVDYASDLSVTANDIVSGFFPIRSEIDMRPLFQALAKTGARLCLPVVLDKNTIVFRDFAGGANLVKTGFGTLGPDVHAAVLDPTVMLVPLAAFDSHGERIGYGGGYYDRAIARLNAKGLSPKLIGVAFECQRVSSIKPEAHDLPMHNILTENGLHRTGAYK